MIEVVPPKDDKMHDVYNMYNVLGQHLDEGSIHSAILVSKCITQALNQIESETIDK